ncbi:hypothetical protein NHX12_001761 [Muraenolepis orangiensis]|uniref:UDENN domain-containing protein n=1 Tax=Muraenolepis orangiensis TaxID=630683 RepID=A0A9Q0E3M8_9TELE|nr:hypothetical protein NHX12_001761 [Muraenolepis orangiensis]
MVFRVGRLSGRIIQSLVLLFPTAWRGLSGSLQETMALPPMMDQLPPALLEACVILGASYDKLKELYQSRQQCSDCNGTAELPLLEPEVLHILAPPFLSRSLAEWEESIVFLEGSPVLTSTRLYSPYGFCLISKYPYYTALKDCLSCLLVQLRTCHLSDMEERVLSCLLQEQRVVLFSADWAQLTLVAESLLLFLKPMSWQQPYVPVLASTMLDFLMAPTAFLMGCHRSHFEEVAAETDDLILINIDVGSVSMSGRETLGLPEIPAAAAECFTQSCSDLNEQRAQKRAWQSSLNTDIQRIALELLVNIFRDVSSHLNFEHRVFNSEEFLKTREPAEQLFYKMVLETHIFHSFLRDRLNRKMDAFDRMELHTRSGMQKTKCMVENPRRPTMQELQARRSSCLPEAKLHKRLGLSLPNLGDGPPIAFQRHASLTKITALHDSIFKLPEFPSFLTLQSTQRFYNELLLLLGKAIFCVPPENSALLARFCYLRGFINTLCFRRLEALSDFQNLYKTDTAIFPTQLVTWLVDSLQREERQLADRRPDLKRLILKVKTDGERLSVQPDERVKRFVLPRTRLPRAEFVRCVQESGIVKDVPTIHRLFDALTDDGDQQQVDPDLFKVFYTFWKEAEAQDVNLPPEVVDHLDNNECVYKLSLCVKTSRGVGKIAMTQKRLFLLKAGRPGLWEIAKFREIKEVKIWSAPFLRLRVPSLHIHTSCRAEVFEANLKTETHLWDLVVREMWAGRKMADQHKDPQYMAQALTNVLLMDAVAGCLQSQRSICSASKLAYFDRIKHEVPMMVPETTSETLKHRVNPSLDLAEPQTVHVLLYTPGQLSCSETEGDGNPKLWVALSGGRVVVFDASSWSMLQDCVQVGNSQLNCMLGVDQDQVWMGSQDSVIYVVDTRSMSCHKQLTEHRHEVTGFSVYSHQPYSCSCEGSILLWDPFSLTVKRQLQITCDRLSSIQVHNGMLWCCCGNSILELRQNGALQRRVSLPDDLLSKPSGFNSFVLITEQGQLWTGCADSGELCVWHTKDPKSPFKRIPLQGISGVNCMIRVKDQIWVGCWGDGALGGLCSGQVKSQVLVVDAGSHLVQKELQAHSDTIHTLCSAEDRYVLSGSGHRDGKIAIWKVE